MTKTLKRNVRYHSHDHAHSLLIQDQPLKQSPPTHKSINHNKRVYFGKSKHGDIIRSKTIMGGYKLDDQQQTRDQIHSLIKEKP